MSTPPSISSVPSEPLTRRGGTPLWGKILASVVGLVLVFFFFQLSEGVRLMLGLGIAGILFFLVMRAPSLGFAAVVVYLAVMGEVRRTLIPAYGWSGTDPLLLVSAITGLLVLGATRRSAKRTPLARLIMFLMALMAVEVVNPLQGGLVVGLSGLLFYLVPLLWYFAAERLGSPLLLSKLAKTVVGIAVVGALYGLWQTAFGLTEFERQWVQVAKESYSALDVGGTTRAFSFFTSAAEYSQFMLLGMILIWVMFLRGQKAGLLLLPFLAVALFLESSRGSIVSLLITVTILWAVQGRTLRSWLPRGLLAAGIAVVGLATGLLNLQNAQLGTQTQSLVTHQVNGLLNPLDPNKSSAGAHTSMVANGILGALHNPIGLGLGASTIAGAKFGGITNSTEVDYSNMFVSLGFLGGCLYLWIVVQVLRRSVDFWRQTRSTSALLILGILLGSFNGWLNGGHYAGSVLVWVCIGVLDRLWPHLSSETRVAKSAPVQTRPAPRPVV